MGGPRPSSDVPIPRVASCETKQVAPVGIQVRFRRAVKFSVRRQTVRKLAPTSARPVQTRASAAPWRHGRRRPDRRREARVLRRRRTERRPPPTSIEPASSPSACRLRWNPTCDTTPSTLLWRRLRRRRRSRRRAPRSSWTSSSPRAGTADGDPRRRRQPPEEATGREETTHQSGAMSLLDRLILGLSLIHI